MSLINDALRKARQAAAEHEDGRAQDPFRVRTAHPRGAPRRSTPSALLAVAVVAALVGAALAWFLIGRSEQTVEVAPSMDRADVASIPPAATESPLHESSPEAAPPPADQAAGPDPPPVRDEPTAGPQPVIVESSAEEPTGSAAEPPTASRPTVGEDGTRIYVLDADLGSTQLSLGYIVARQQNPFAEINGRDVFIGSEIEGFTVEAIEADRVVLRDQDGKLVLRVP
jgi:hypothetical protein